MGIFFEATAINPPYYLYPPYYIYVATDVVHVSHTYGAYGSDYLIPPPCNTTGWVEGLHGISMDNNVI